MNVDADHELLNMGFNNMVLDGSNIRYLNIRHVKHCTHVVIIIMRLHYLL
jgi:hypothetical protein